MYAQIFKEMRYNYLKMLVRKGQFTAQIFKQISYGQFATTSECWSVHV
jgi:hypothetical protein